MTLRQLQVLNFIEDYWTENWTSPTYQEIANGIGVSSKATSYDIVQRLVRHGFLERKDISRRRVLYRVRYEGIDQYSSQCLAEFWEHRDAMRARYQTSKSRLKSGVLVEAG